MSQPNELLRPNELSPIDLAYAVNQLIARGTTTAREVSKAARRRCALVASIRRDLAELGGLNVAVMDEATGRVLSVARLTYPAARTRPLVGNGFNVAVLDANRQDARASAHTSALRRLAPMSAASVVAPAGQAPIATNGTKPSKRPFRWTPKLRAARKLQGQYIGALRKLAGKPRERVRAVTKREGVAAGLAAARAAVKIGNVQVRDA